LENLKRIAVAIINPHLKECEYPDKNLAGVGVAFNLMMALRKRLRDTGLAADVNLLQYLDLVAMGTVADVMPLTGAGGLGLTLHSGNLKCSHGCHDKELGSALLFREALEAGYQINRHHSLSLIFFHISNARVYSENDGMNHLGVRYGYSF